VESAILESRRNVVLRRARYLAKSGWCADHRDVWEALRRYPDHMLVSEFFKERGFKALLDRMCVVAKSKAGENETADASMSR
jgi:hypothetical protein